jgi:hypothetical protein
MAKIMIKFLSVLFLFTLSYSIEMKSFLKGNETPKFYSLTNCNLNKDRESLTCSASFDKNIECYYNLNKQVANCVNPLHFHDCFYDSKEVKMKCHYGQYSLCSWVGDVKKENEIVYGDKLKCLKYNPLKLSSTDISQLFGVDNGILTFYSSEFNHVCKECEVADEKFGCSCPDGSGNFNFSSKPLNQYLRWDSTNSILSNLKDHQFEECSYVKENQELTCTVPNGTLKNTIDISNCLQNSHGVLEPGFGFHHSCYNCRIENSNFICSNCDKGLGEYAIDTSIEMYNFLVWQPYGLHCKNGEHQSAQ